MKKVASLFTLIINFSFGQNSIKNEDFTDWEDPKNFEKFELKKVRYYSIKINKKGKIKKDSLLLSEYNYDKMRNEIYGTFHYVVVASHAETHLEFYNFKNNYTQDGLLLQKVNTPVKKEKNTKEEIEFKRNFEIFEYDSLKRKIKETTYEESNTIRLHNKDTTSYFKSINYPKITEFEYDSKNRIIKQFFLSDSTTNFYKNYLYKNDNQKEFKKTKKCYSCEPKYLDQEWIYENDILKKYINYSYKKEVHTKIYYYYNSFNKLIKQIDSTWFNLKKPIHFSTKNIEYTNENIIETLSNYDRNTITKYDLKKNILSEHINSHTPFYEREVYYYYSNEMTIKISKISNEIILKEVFLYDKRGLLIEKKEFYNEIISQLTRYYYE